MLEQQRHQRILYFLGEIGFVSVKKLSSQLNASEATIRRDINKLCKLNKLKKIRGGAQAVTCAEQTRALSANVFSVNRGLNSDNKRRIAKKAVSLCQEGESIVINGGSTTYMMGEFLIQRNVNILTNSFSLAQYVGEHGGNQLTLPGGEIYRSQGIILSAFENDTIQYYHGNKMFMGAQGVTPVGVTESDPLLIRAEQKLKKQALQLVVLADSSKLGTQGNFIFCPLKEVDILITDTAADPKIIAELRDGGIEVMVV